MLKSVIEPYALPDTVYTQMVMKKIIGRKPGCRFFWGPAPAQGQVPLCYGARYPLGPVGLVTPSQR